MPLTDLGSQSRLVVATSMLAEDPINTQHGQEYVARGDVILAGDILDRLALLARTEHPDVPQLDALFGLECLPCPQGHALVEFFANTILLFFFFHHYLITSKNQRRYYTVNYATFSPDASFEKSYRNPRISLQFLL